MKTRLGAGAASCHGSGPGSIKMMRLWLCNSDFNGNFGMTGLPDFKEVTAGGGFNLIPGTDS
jgi:hypothetical protein